MMPAEGEKKQNSLFFLLTKQQERRTNVRDKQVQIAE